MRSSWLFAVVLLGTTGCRSCSSAPATKADAVDARVIGPPVAKLPFELVAKNAELWAYRRPPKPYFGSYVVVRAHDFARVGAFELNGDVVEKPGAVFPGARFCAGDRLAIRTAHPFGTLAGIWDARTGFHSLAGGDSDTIGWSETCELVSLQKDPEAKRVTIRLASADREQTLEVDAADGDASVLDVTAHAVVVVLGDAAPDAGRVAIIDRNTSKATTLRRAFVQGSSFARVDDQSFAVAPSFEEGPFVVRAHGELDPAAKLAFAARPRPTPAADAVTAAVDATKNVVVLFDGKQFAWWSLSPRRRLALRKIEGVASKSDFRIVFTPTTTVAFTPFGDVVGAVRESTVAYRQPLARGETTKAIASEDGLAIAIGSKDAPSTVVVDAATGKTETLSAPGVPRAFVDGHDKVLVGEAIWSMTEKRIVGEAPD